VLQDSHAGYWGSAIASGGVFIGEGRPGVVCQIRIHSRFLCLGNNDKGLFGIETTGNVIRIGIGSVFLGFDPLEVLYRALAETCIRRVGIGELEPGAYNAVYGNGSFQRLCLIGRRLKFKFIHLPVYINQLYCRRSLVNGDGKLVWPRHGAAVAGRVDFDIVLSGAQLVIIPYAFTVFVRFFPFQRVKVVSLPCGGIIRF